MSGRPETRRTETDAEPFGHTHDTGALREQMIVLADKGLPGT
nr:hypothetical protein [Phytoactinopolyspora halophila]